MKRISIIISFLAVIISAFSQQKTFSNPIIPGFHPDPSICRVGDDFYLVTSSFEWFPGLPIYHSKDLMNWEQIGHVLNRPSQLQMKVGMKNSAGLWAPTIRYHQGKFYVICTAQQAGGNFFVTADKPEGPYSEPTFLTDAPGIDPSLFFDDDGTCWYTGSINGTPKEDKYPNEDRIYIQQLDLEKGKLVGERTIITTGHAVNAPYTEAPHIYKINGKYFLMVAEGGTWTNHAITLFSSDKVTGPYTAGIANPVLTHRHLGNDIDITTIGHGDLVQAQNGDWWCVMLGVRPLSGLTMLGRETFITPVKFQNGWPVFNPGVGRVLMNEKVTGLPFTAVNKPIERDEFEKSELNFVWCFLRTPFDKWYELKNNKLQLNLRPERVQDLVNPTLIARRIEHFNFDASVSMNFTPNKAGEEAGIILMQNGKNSYRLVLKKQVEKDSILLYKTEKGVESIVYAEPYKLQTAVFKVEARGLSYQFCVGENEWNCKAFGNSQDASVLSSNIAGGFIGPFIGMYASSNGKNSKNKAQFNWFEYKAIADKALPKLAVSQVSINDIAIRDPFILPNKATKTYYLYGATRENNERPNDRNGVKMYKSNDLKTWTGPYLVYETPANSWADPKHGVWAPEVHYYNGKYYLFATFTNEAAILEEQIEGRCILHKRGTQILVSDTPEGPFEAYDNKAITPENWMALDGTLWEENGKPYMIFCHEWVQTVDGTMEYVRLKDDLSDAVGVPKTMFKATDAPWVRALEEYKKKPLKGYITDGCFMHKNSSGKLVMMWSSFGEKGYAVSTAVSTSGKLAGPWKQNEQPIFAENGGHAMFFKTFEGKMILVLHYPNSGATPKSRFFELTETDDSFELGSELKY